MSVWRCPVCEGVNQGGRTCTACGAVHSRKYGPEIILAVALLAGRRPDAATHCAPREIRKRPHCCHPDARRDQVAAPSHSPIWRQRARTLRRIRLLMIS
jgi:hypothetical protein